MRHVGLPKLPDDITTSIDSARQISVRRRRLNPGEFPLA